MHVRDNVQMSDVKDLLDLGDAPKTREIVATKQIKVPTLEDKSKQKRKGRKTSFFFVDST